MNRTITTNINKISFKNRHTVYENFIKCTIKDYEYNLSYNPTLLSGSQGLLVPYSSSTSGDIFYVNTGSNVGILKDFTTGSEFSPYVTTVGLYNDAQELLMVGKLAAPIPLSNTTDTTFLIRYDLNFISDLIPFPSPSPSIVPSVTPSITPSISITPTITPSITPSPSSGSIAPSVSITPTVTTTPTVTPTITPTPTPSAATPPIAPIGTVIGPYWGATPGNPYNRFNIQFYTGSGPVASSFNIKYAQFPTSSTLTSNPSGPFTISSGYGTVSNTIAYENPTLIYDGFTPAPTAVSFYDKPDAYFRIETYNAGGTGSTNYQFYQDFNGGYGNTHSFVEPSNYAWPSGTPYLSASNAGSAQIKLTYKYNGITTGSIVGVVTLYNNGNYVTDMLAGPGYPTPEATITGVTGVDDHVWSVYEDTVITPVYSPITQFKYP
jgi:hypothetical protein